MGISIDSPFVQEVFAARLGVTFPLLGDANRTAGRAYEVLLEEAAGIKEVSERAAFVISPAGEVAYRWVDAGEGLPDMDEVVQAVKASWVSPRSGSPR